MRAIRVLGVVGMLAAVVFLAPVALAAGHWYVRADLSYNHVADNGWGSPNGPVSTRSNKGAGLDLAFGRSLGRVWAGGGVRGEFELTWKNNGIDSFTQNGRRLTGVTGHTRMVALMYNLVNDFLPESTFDPYLGVGIGYADVSYGNYYGYDAATNTESRLNSSDSVFAYQVLAGFNVRVTQSVSLGLAYNWLVLADPSLTEPASAGYKKTTSSYVSNSVTLGLTWRF
jgi:opacity protein-like surface antigen